MITLLIVVIMLRKTKRTNNNDFITDIKNIKHIKDHWKQRSPMVFCIRKRRIIMRKIKVERYTERNGEVWVRIKFMDAAGTEVIMPEEEFVKQYGRVD